MIRFIRLVLKKHYFLGAGRKKPNFAQETTAR